MLLGNIWITSILQTLLDHGDNPRFLVPLQSLVVLWVAAFILQLVIHIAGDAPRLHLSDNLINYPCEFPEHE